MIQPTFQRKRDGYKTRLDIMTDFCMLGLVGLIYQVPLNSLNNKETSVFINTFKCQGLNVIYLGSIKKIFTNPL